MTPQEKSPFSAMYRKGYINGYLKAIETIMVNLAKMQEKVNEKTKEGGEQ